VTDFRMMTNLDNHEEKGSITGSALNKKSSFVVYENLWTTGRSVLSSRKTV
jgi:orotate phosphoribosyltransferase